MRILADRHHAGLFYSLQLLFEDHLGATVYTPIGMEWWTDQYWRFGEVYGDDRLARQYLALDAGWVDDQARLRTWNVLAIDANLIDGQWSLFKSHYETEDSEFPDRTLRGVTLVQAQDMTWDVVIATVQENQAGFARFAREHGAKFVVAVGNTGQHIDWSLDPLVLNSSEMPIVGRGVQIGQEFDSEGTFARRPIRWRRTISSFVNCMPVIACWPLMQEAQAALPEFHFAVHGIAGPDGNVKPITDTAALMAASGWGWHDKIHGDGFGHVLHYWAAIGRPIIGHASHYAGKRGEVFWRDLETCIDLDRHPLDEAVTLIREISADPERHDAMGKAIRRVFDETCDWEADAQAVRELLA